MQLGLECRHGKETGRGVPAKVSSVPRCFFLEANRQCLGRFNLLVQDDGAMREVIAGLWW